MSSHWDYQLPDLETSACQPWTSDVYDEITAGFGTLGIPPPIQNHTQITSRLFCFIGTVVAMVNRCEKTHEAQAQPAVYEARAITGYRRGFYQVWWAGYPQAASTWENAKRIEREVPDLVSAYRTQCRK